MRLRVKMLHTLDLAAFPFTMNWLCNFMMKDNSAAEERFLILDFSDQIRF